MDVELYTTPAPGKNRAVASEWLNYLFRPQELGIICTSEILKDPQFAQDIKELRQQQIDDFSKISEKSLDMWRTRVFPDPDPSLPAKKDPNYRSRVKQAMILAREENINDTGVRRKLSKFENIANAQQLVHDLMLTQKYEFTTGKSSGKRFQHQLDKSILNLPADELEEKIRASLVAVRSCFPENIPLVLTFHLGKTGQEPHIQGWVCDKMWDSETKSWTKDWEGLDKGGLGDLRRQVDKAVAEAVGCGFGDASKKLDSNRPKITIWDEKVTARRKYWLTHLSREEYMAGKGIELEQNALVKEAMRQHVAQASYDDQKVLVQQRKAKEQAQLRRLSMAEAFDSCEEALAFQSSIKRAVAAEEATKAYRDTNGGGKNSNYYREVNYYARLTEEQKTRYNGFTGEQLRAELADLQSSVRQIDSKLESGNLSPDERRNLGFTRDSEIRVLKHVKSLVSELPTTAAPVTMVKAEPIVTVKAAPVAPVTKESARTAQQLRDMNRVAEAEAARAQDAAAKPKDRAALMNLGKTGMDAILRKPAAPTPTKPSHVRETFTETTMEEIERLREEAAKKPTQQLTKKSVSL